MATTEETTFTYLYYYIQNLFNLISLESIQATQEVRDNTGKALVDRYAIHERDRLYFERLLKSAASNVFKTISRMSQTITNAYQFNVDLNEIVDSLDSGKGLIYIFELPAYFDNNILGVLDTDIEDALKFHLLMEWFNHKGLRDLSMQYRSEYMDKLADIKQSRLMSIKTTGRPYNMGIPIPN